MEQGGTQNQRKSPLGAGFQDFLRLGETVIWWPRAESNHRHKDFQSSALPTELLGLLKQSHPAARVNYTANWYDTCFLKCAILAQRKTHWNTRAICRKTSIKEEHGGVNTQALAPGPLPRILIHFSYLNTRTRSGWFCKEAEAIFMSDRPRLSYPIIRKSGH